MEGRKYDTGKPEWDLMPWDSLEDVVKVLDFGAKKYEPDNWKRVPYASVRYIAAAFRHLIARAIGKKIDSETKLPHVAHAICCLLFLNWFDRKPRDKTQRVYISGPITGMPNLNQEAFIAAEKIIASRGYIPVNPWDISIVNIDKKWDDYLRADIKALCDCDYIYLLDGWEKSAGATLEVHIADSLGLTRLAKQDMDA
jgi:hypothetical protein